MTKEQLKKYREHKALAKHYEQKAQEEARYGVCSSDNLDRYLGLMRLSGEHYRQVTVIEEAIASVPDPTAQLLLRLRYIEGRSWVQVRFALHYSESQTKRIHARALKWLEGVNIE